MNGFYKDVQRILELGSSAGAVVIAMVSSSNYLGAIALYGIGPAQVFNVHPCEIKWSLPRVVESLYWSIMFIYTIPIWIVSSALGLVCCNCALFCSLFRATLCCGFLFIVALVGAIFSSWARERLIMYLYYFGCDFYLVFIHYLGQTCTLAAAGIFACMIGASPVAVKLACQKGMGAQQIASMANIRPLQ